MKQFLTFRLNLFPASWQTRLLLATLKSVNLACNLLSQFAWKQRAFTRTALSKRQYMRLRHQCNLPSSLVISAILKVCDCYANHLYRKRDKPLSFSPFSAITYDRRGCSFTPSEVKIRVLDRRLSIPFKCPPMPPEWEKRWVSARLIYRKKRFYLDVIVPIDCPAPATPTGVLGVDTGLINLAVDSDGEYYITDSRIPSIRRRYAERRQSLQRKAAEKKELGVRPRSVIRKLQMTSGKEKRLVANLLHCTAKRLVMKARGTNRAIALENLQGIRKTHQRPRGHRGETAVRRQSRHQINVWPCWKFRKFVEYKARVAGVIVIAVQPYATSTTCPVCGEANKANRKSRDEFCCVACGYSGPADYIAAVNISRRGSEMLAAAGLSLPAYSVTALASRGRKAGAISLTQVSGK